MSTMFQKERLKHKEEIECETADQDYYFSGLIGISVEPVSVYCKTSDLDIFVGTKLICCFSKWSCTTASSICLSRLLEDFCAFKVSATRFEQRYKLYIERCLASLYRRCGQLHRRYGQLYRRCVQLRGLRSDCSMFRVARQSYS